MFCHVTRSHIQNLELESNSDSGPMAQTTFLGAQEKAMGI